MSVCLWCEEPFKQNPTGNKKYCRPSHRVSHHRFGVSRNERDAAKLNDARLCEMCEGSMAGKPKTARFCGRDCYLKWWGGEKAERPTEIISKPVVEVEVGDFVCWNFEWGRVSQISTWGSWVTLERDGQKVAILPPRDIQVATETATGTP